MNLTPDWSLTDKSTWITILTWIASGLAIGFHANLSPYIAPAATVAAGIVTAAVALAKHHLSAITAASSGTTKTVTTVTTVQAPAQAVTTATAPVIPAPAPAAAQAAAQAPTPAP